MQDGRKRQRQRQVVAWRKGGCQNDAPNVRDRRLLRARKLFGVTAVATLGEGRMVPWRQRGSEGRRHRRRQRQRQERRKGLFEESERLVEWVIPIKRSTYLETRKRAWREMVAPCHKTYDERVEARAQAMFMQLIDELPKHLLMQLISMDGTDAYYYDPSSQSSEKSNLAMPWPILFTITRFNSKHIFTPRAAPMHG